MKRAALIHWHRAAGEAEKRAFSLRSPGLRIQALSPDGMAGLKALREFPPDAVVIDLDRLPSHGRAVAVALRQLKATRGIPIVFAGGAPEKVAATRKLLPDAVYAEWRGIKGALKLALRAKPASNAKPPVVPDTMAGYSGTPLPKKLGIKDDSQVILLGAPAGFDQVLGKLPPGVRVKPRLGGEFDLILCFARTRAELARRLPASAAATTEGVGLWIVWPKKTSALAADLGELEVRAAGLATGLVDYKICAVDATWSGLKFTRRRLASGVATPRATAAPRSAGRARRAQAGG